MAAIVLSWFKSPWMWNFLSISLTELTCSGKNAKSASITSTVYTTAPNSLAHLENPGILPHPRSITCKPERTLSLLSPSRYWEAADSSSKTDAGAQFVFQRTKTRVGLQPAARSNGYSVQVFCLFPYTFPSQELLHIFQADTDSTTLFSDA